MRVPFARPDRNDADKAAMCAAYDSGWWTSGPWTARLEDMAKELTGARNVVAVNSCATALWMATQKKFDTQEIGDVESVDVPAIGGHFISNAYHLVHDDAGFTFKVMDCDHDLCTKGVHYVLDYGGRVSDLTGSERSWEDANGQIIDCAYTLGAPGDAKPRGWVRCYSLQATKGVTSGEGGLLATEDDDFAAWCRKVRSHGMCASSYERGEGDYEVVVPGGGFLLPDILSAVAVSQLQRAGEMRARRVQIAMDYDKALAPSVLAGRVIPVERDYDKDALGLYALRINSAPVADGTYRMPFTRKDFREMMFARGVSTRNHYRFISDNPAYSLLREQAERDCPLARRISREVVTLPLSSALTDEEVEWTCNALKEVLA